jgi:putative phosphoesterase
MRIGLVSDTHDDLCDWPAVRDRVATALAGVDLVVHCGDLTTLAVLEDLEKLAPVRATRNDRTDPEPIPGRLEDGPIVINADGATIGVMFELPEPVAGTNWEATFGRAVDVVVFGGTHAPLVEQDGDVLLVNPGSPSLAAELSVGELVVGAGPPSARIIGVPAERAPQS